MGTEHRKEPIYPASGKLPEALCTCRLEGKATDWRDPLCPVHGSETWDWSTQVPPDVDAMIRVDGGDTMGRFGRVP